MHLSSIRVFNYKSFINSGTIELKPGINVIVGQNNAGKTALLETLTLNSENIRHESLLTKPTKDIVLSSQSVSTFRVSLSSPEIISILEIHDSIAFSVPKHFIIKDSENYSDEFRQIHNELLKFLNSKLEGENSLVGTYDSVEHRISEIFLQIDNDIDLPDQYWQSRKSDDLNNSSALAHGFKDGNFTQIQSNLGTGLPKKVLNEFINNIFKFSAKRINLETSLPVEGINLQSDCSNLAGVITNLASEHRDMFRELLELTSSVIPSVKDAITKRQPHSSGMGFEYSLQTSAYDSKKPAWRFSKKIRAWRNRYRPSSCNFIHNRNVGISKSYFDR